MLAWANPQALLTLRAHTHTHTKKTHIHTNIHMHARTHTHTHKRTLSRVRTHTVARVTKPYAGPKVKDKIVATSPVGLRVEGVGVVF